MTSSNTLLNPAFVHLRMHTEYSVVDGLVRISDAVKQAKSDQMPALAISDLSNLFAWVRFYRQCRAAGIKPIAAVDVWVESLRGSAHTSRLLLIVMNRQGYLQLCELLSKAYLHNHHQGRATIQYEWFEQIGCEGLIALSSFDQSDFGQALLMGHFQA